MWPASRAIGKDTEDPDMFFCDPNPISPIANNPDHSAVQLTLEFESWQHPIIFPNDVLETNTAYLPRYLNEGNNIAFIHTILIYRTLTRDSYENGISVITKAMRTNEAMLMVSKYYLISLLY